MTTALVILGVLGALFLAAALATRDSQALAPAPPDAADVVLPARVGADDVRALRFGLAARGYRMSEVDAALERLAAELEDRDRRIAELSGEPPLSGEQLSGESQGEESPDGDLDTGPVEVDGITTAGLGSAGAGMDPLLPSVPAPDADRTAGTAPDGARGDSAPAGARGDSASAGARGGSAPVAARGGSSPDVSVGQVPREPVDPPVRPV